MSARRIAGAGWGVDRRRPVSFRFDGRAMVGYAGDTLASALLANGVDVVGRSFKLHRPRGIMAMGPEDPNGFVHVVAPVEEPNALATAVPLVEGLEARSVHGWPQAGLDLLAPLNWLKPVLTAGFYYKTFIGRGGNLWPRVEPLIRRLAGLGPAPTTIDPLPSENRTDWVDVLVVGGGPAGLAAARIIAEGGRSVLLVEQDGGSPHPDLVSDWNALAARADVTVLRGAAALGLHGDGLVTVHERRPAEPFLRDRLRKVRAGAIVLATGTVEQPVMVAGNDRPGVMLAGSAARLFAQYGVACGERAVLIANNRQAVADAEALSAAGIAIAAVVDPGADLPAPGPKVPVFRPDAVSIRGARRVTGVVLRSDGQTRRIACDTVLMSGGHLPELALWSQAGGRVVWSKAAQGFLPVGTAEAFLCGSAAGHVTAAAIVLSGQDAGRAALDRLAGRPAFQPDFGPGLTCSSVLGVKPIKPGEPAFVDIHNDVTLHDVDLARREGYRAPDHLKRYTTLGMGPDQGRTAARNGAARLFAGEMDAIQGPTTRRPPWRPVPFSALAGPPTGPLASPTRATPLTAWAEAKAAVFYDSGAQWRRPGYFPQPGETLAAAARREALAVRAGVGVYDSSPLGKIRLRGPDAARFLDLVYAGRLSTLKAMTGRYALMLREDGRVFDDGVVFRESETEFTLTTTSGNASAALSWLEYLRAQVFPGLVVRMLDVTEVHADICLCGPTARTLLARLAPGLDLSPASFPPMAMRDCIVAGRPARVLRVSFTGELSYEIWTAPEDAPGLWQAALADGIDLGITPVGSEANHILRVEKGYLSVGHEVDGIVDPVDLGLSRFVAMDKPDFIGKRALLRNRADPQPRPELVGLLVEDGGPPLMEGAPVGPAAAICPGFVTASVDSPALGRPIALALLAGGHAALGETVIVADRTGERPCRVTAPVFHDPDGARLRA